SSKGRQLQDNPRAAAVMHWDALHRQVRIEGAIVPAPASDSDAYFASRPWQSRVAAWASEQSEPIASRAALLEAVSGEAKRFGVPVPGSPGAPDSVRANIPRPLHWGGYRLWADAVELWVEGEARVHDRALWRRSLMPLPGATLHRRTHGEGLRRHRGFLRARGPPLRGEHGATGARGALPAGLGAAAGAGAGGGTLRGRVVEPEAPLVRGPRHQGVGTRAAAH